MKETKRIIVVDDDHIFLYLAEHTLKKMYPDCEVIKCLNGKEAIAELQLTIPDMLFLDINMPAMSGWEFLKNLENLSIKLSFPIYMVTSSVSLGDKDRAASFNSVKGFIEKPLNVEKIMAQELI